MPYESLTEAMRTLRAVRHFTAEPVSHEILRQVMELATKAPNDRNLQDWRFIAVRDQETRSRIGRIYLDSLLEYHKLPTAGQVLAKPDLPPMQRDSVLMAQAMSDVPPVLIVALYHQTSGLDPGMSLYPAIQNLMLAAWSFGLGTVMTTVARRKEAELRDLLGIPEDVVFVSLVPMGYPAKTQGPPRRRPIKEVTFEDKWGAPLSEA